MNRTKWSRSAGALVASVLLLAGCSELTTGGFGEVEVYATANATQTPFQGQLAVELQVFLQHDASGQWIELTEGVRDLTLDLRGEIERRVTIRFVEAARYTRLRVVYGDVEADVLGGLVVGGAPLTGVVAVDFGSQGARTVEREVLVEVEGDQALDLVLDLNVDVWLPAASATTRTVPGNAFPQALSVTLR